jgi:hypothetical protein
LQLAPGHSIYALLLVFLSPSLLHLFSSAQFGFNPPLRRFRQGFQQLLIDEHKPGRQPTAVEMINTRLAGFASAP